MGWLLGFWLAGWFRSVIGKKVVRVVLWLVTGWLDGWLVSSWLSGWFLAGWLVGWLVYGWLAGCGKSAVRERQGSVSGWLLVGWLFG